MRDSKGGKRTDNIVQWKTGREDNWCEENHKNRTKTRLPRHALTRWEGEKLKNRGGRGNKMRGGDPREHTTFTKKGKYTWLPKHHFAIDLSCAADRGITNRVYIITEVTWKTIISWVCHEFDWWDTIGTLTSWIEVFIGAGGSRGNEGP
jgi:hypothetical protein